MTTQRMLLFLLFAFLSPCIASINPTESLFLNVPHAESAKRHLKFITSMPHVAGTFGDTVMAEYVSDQFRSMGIPHVSTFDLEVYLNYPKARPQVSLIHENSSCIEFQAKLSEDLLDDTSDTFWRNHTFHGYSPSGNVTAPLVFANYGRPSDFEALRGFGIPIKNSIVITRYGKCFRGLKVRNAQKHGAVGVFIYSDPADDGYGQGDVYPRGPWRPSSGVQRGSVQFNSACAGDPMRVDKRYAQHNWTLEIICGISNYKDWIPRIPSLPLSYSDAQPFLESLGGPTALDVFGSDFDGGLHINYTVGPSTHGTLVNMVVHNEEAIGNIPNVIGYIPGSLPPEQDLPVLLGNHRDAWVYGAADPNSGTASLLEVARGLGKLLETGWTPRRSIYLTSWSGEEYGLLGSTGWAELQHEKIQRAVAYLNADTMVSGDYLSVEISPSLSTLWQGVLDDLWNSTSVLFGNGPHGDMRDANTNWKLFHNHFKQGLLGSGSDYTVFLDHFGIASLDMKFQKKTTYGQYHSIYDSFAWMDAYGGMDEKPGSAFEFMAVGAKIWGLMALRLADSIVLPMDHVVLGSALFNYTHAIEDQPFRLDLTLLKAAVHDYQQAAHHLHKTCFSTSRPTNTQACNDKLGLTERQFLNDAGLPGRPWFKHILQAPGMDLGYAAEAFPSIQQAIHDNNQTLAQQQVLVVTERIKAAASFLRISDDQPVATSLS